MLTPRLDILPAPQRRIWPRLAQVPTGFVLYGGTAIALYLGHRKSVDFDFFLDRNFDPDSLLEQIPFLRGAAQLAKSANTLICRVDEGQSEEEPVQVSFFGVPKLPRLEAPTVLDNGVALASLRDLAGTKAAVVQKRSEAKDYLDIAALIALGKLPLSLALDAAQQLYGDTFNPELTLKALCYFGDGNLASVPEPVRQSLKRAVANLESNRA